MAEELKLRLGINSSDLKKLEETIKRFSELTGKMGKGGQSFIAGIRGGIFGPSAGVGAVGLAGSLGKMVGSLGLIAGTLGVIAGAIQKMLNILIDASPKLKGTFMILDKALKIFFQPFGDALAALIKPLVVSFLKFAKEFRKSPVGAVAGAVGGALGGAAEAVGGALGGAAEAVGGVLGGAAEAVDEAIAKPLKQVKENIEHTFKNIEFKPKSIWDSITGAFNAGIKGMKDLGEFLLGKDGILTKAFEAAVKGMNDLGEFLLGGNGVLTKAFEAAVKGMNDLGEFLLGENGVLTKAFEAAVKGMNDLGAFLLGEDGVLTKAFEAAIEGMNDLGEFLMGSTGKLVEWFIKSINGMRDFGAWLWGVVTEKINKGIGVLVNLGKAIYDALMRAINAAVSKAIEMFSGMFTGGSNTSSSSGKKDFIMRPGQPAVSFSPDDTVIGVRDLNKLGGKTITIHNTFNVSGSISSDSDLRELAERLAEIMNSTIRRKVSFA